jgi:ATP-dependent Clp protease adaptor protein ClpS
VAATTLIDPATRERTSLAPLYRVLVHDDPITTFDFVERVLRLVFAKSAGEAQRITREANDTGVAVADVLPLEPAEFRCERAHALARAQGFPLTFTLELDG